MVSRPRLMQGSLRPGTPDLVRMVPPTPKPPPSAPPPITGPVTSITNLDPRLDLSRMAAGPVPTSVVPPGLQPVPPPGPIPRATPVDKPITDSSKATDADYTRLELVSRFLPYEFKSLSVRRFKVRDLAKIHMAVSSSNLTLLIDAIGGTIDQDVRQLTYPDFRQIMFWHRFESYPSSPYEWIGQSRYGNEVKVTQSQLEEKPLTLSVEEYAQWTAEGFSLPTMREHELFSIAHMTPQQDWLFRRAQYLNPSLYWNGVVNANDPYHIQAACNYLEDQGIEILEKIREFSEVTDHRLIETITFRDPQFDPNKRAEQLRGLIVTMSRANVNLELVEVMTNELNEIESKLEAGIEVQAAEETRELGFDALSFFPRL